MADSSYEKGLSELSKMKVADLKAELKQRGLPISGNKNELVERLQLALHGASDSVSLDSTLSLDETTEEMLDEEILGDEEIEELSSKPDSQETPEKRTSTDSNSNGATNGKKIVLNRKTVIEDIKIDDKPEKEKETPPKVAENAVAEKKVIKLSELSMQERLEMRKRKFGMPLSDSAKKLARAARFNMDDTNSSASSGKVPEGTSYEMLMKRKERFGCSVSSAMEKAELQERIEKRKARFGEVKPIDKVFGNKIKIVK